MTRFIICLMLCFSMALAADEIKEPDSDNTNDGNTSCNSNAYDTLNEDPAGGDWCTADNNNTDWEFIFTMENPSGSLDNTADAQAIRYYVRSYDEGQGDDPTIQMWIYDGTDCADLHEAGTEYTLTDAGYPAEITDTWTSSGLSSEDDVCVRIYCTKSGGAPGNRNSCDIDNVVWDVELATGISRRVIVIP